VNSIASVHLPVVQTIKNKNQLCNLLCEGTAFAKTPNKPSAISAQSTFILEKKNGPKNLENLPSTKDHTPQTTSKISDSAICALIG